MTAKALAPPEPTETSKVVEATILDLGKTIKRIKNKGINDDILQTVNNTTYDDNDYESDDDGNDDDSIKKCLSYFQDPNMTMTTPSWLNHLNWQIMHRNRTI